MDTIGVFGGTFSPFHLGHLQALASFSRSYDFDKIFIIPTGIPPHKTKTDDVSGNDRLEMARIASAGIKNSEICRYEVEKGGKSYTADTLEFLSAKFPGHKLVFYTGSDMFLTIQNWYRPEKIFSLAEIAVFSRTADDLEELEAHSVFLKKKFGAESRVFKTEPFIISSSEIREKLARGEGCAGLVPEKVLEYINEKNLYKEKAGL